MMDMQKEVLGHMIILKGLWLLRSLDVMSPDFSLMNTVPKQSKKHIPENEH
jgi:hypothetical protein